MARLRLWFWAVPPALVCMAGPFCSDVKAQPPAYSARKSWTESVTSPFKQGFDKVGRAVTPQPKLPRIPENDAVSLKSKAKAGPELYLAIARLYEQSGKTAEAEQQYQAALGQFPNDLSVLLAYAQWNERLGKPQEASRIYLRAAKMYPQQASVYNNLGLCYARQNRLDEAVANVSHAIQLEPENSLYRNNLATVLVDRGDLRGAFTHLQAVHGNAAAHYNLGYLLQKKGQVPAALQHFQLALQADPSLVGAQRWIDHLQRMTTQARLPNHPMAAGVRITNPLAAAEGELAPPLDEPPQRLPPTRLPEIASERTTLPGISYQRSAFPTAPLPPEPARTAVRPLPRVE